MGGVEAKATLTCRYEVTSLQFKGGIQNGDWNSDIHSFDTSFGKKNI